MAENDYRKNDADPQYEETTEPQNPPNSIVRPRARRRWLASSLGTVVLIVAVIAAVFTWVMVQRSLGGGPLHRSDPRAIGTAGTRDGRIHDENSPGGFNPVPRPDSTADELRFRGSNQTTIAKLEDATTGSQVNLSDVRVERASGDTFTIRDGDDTATVVVPGGMPTVRDGQRINVSGTLEMTGATPRIRASRIDVR
jgi:uncharacterized protein YdeI (BOF family)